jgi:hypothetical protein
MSPTIRRTRGSERFASSTVNRRRGREGRTDLGVKNCGPAMDNHLSGWLATASKTWKRGRRAERDYATPAV